MNSAVGTDPAAGADHAVRADLRAFANVRVFADHGVRLQCRTPAAIRARGAIDRGRMNSGEAIGDSLDQHGAALCKRDFRLSVPQHRLARRTPLRPARSRRARRTPRRAAHVSPRPHR